MMPSSPALIWRSGAGTSSGLALSKREYRRRRSAHQNVERLAGARGVGGGLDRLHRGILGANRGRRSGCRIGGRGGLGGRGVLVHHHLASGAELALVLDHAGGGAGAIRDCGGADAECVIHTGLLIFGRLRDGGGREQTRGESEGEGEPDLHGKSPVLQGLGPIPAPPGTSSTASPSSC